MCIFTYICTYTHKHTHTHARARKYTHARHTHAYSLKNYAFSKNCDLKKMWFEKLRYFQKLCVFESVFRSTGSFLHLIKNAMQSKGRERNISGRHRVQNIYMHAHLYVLVSTRRFREMRKHLVEMQHDVWHVVLRIRWAHTFVYLSLSHWPGPPLFLTLTNSFSRTRNTGLQEGRVSDVGDIHSYTCTPRICCVYIQMLRTYIFPVHLFWCCVHIFPSTSLLSTCDTTKRGRWRGRCTAQVYIRIPVRLAYVAYIYRCCVDIFPSTPLLMLRRYISLYISFVDMRYD